MGSPDTPKAQRIFAVVPSRNGIQYLTEHGQIPSSTWRQEDGSYEGTFSRIGQRLIGRALPVDWAHRAGAGTVYLAKPVEPGTFELREGVEWSGLELGPVSHGAAQDYWRQFILDAARAVANERR